MKWLSVFAYARTNWRFSAEGQDNRDVRAFFKFTEPRPSRASQAEEQPDVRGMAPCEFISPRTKLQSFGRWFLQLSYHPPAPTHSNLCRTLQNRRALRLKRRNHRRVAGRFLQLSQGSTDTTPPYSRFLRTDSFDSSNKRGSRISLVS